MVSVLRIIGAYPLDTQMSSRIVGKRLRSNQSPSGALKRRTVLPQARWKGLALTTFTALTALLLDGVSGGLAGAIGLALADILAGDPGYAVTTFVLKFIIGITCGAVAHKAFKLRDLDKHSSGYLVKVIVSAGSGLLLNVLTDPFLGYFRNVYIFGQEYTVAQALTKIAGGITFVNSVASTVCVVILYLALRPALERAGLLPKGKN